MFSTELGFTLEAAFREAVTRRHMFFCLEHLLFALLFDDHIIEIVRACGGDEREIRNDLEKFFKDHVDQFPQGGGGKEVEPQQTPALRRVLQRAIVHMQSAGKDIITSQEVLATMYMEEDSHAVSALKNQGITRLDILNYISHGVSKTNPLSDSESKSSEEDDDDELEESELTEGKAEKKNRDALLTYTEDLTAKARSGELDPVVGRDREIERALKVLARRQKNNPLFLGEPGVGKTAMAAAIALRIVEGKVPPSLKDARIFSLQVGALVAGTKFRGEFEERVRQIVKQLTRNENTILFIDEIHQMVGAGATGTGSMDAANLLKPALASGKLRCIGSTTHEDFKKSFDKDRALSRRFSTIDLTEPSIPQTVEILKGLKERFETHHKVKYSSSALHAAAELSAKHITERFLPDKAIDVIDEAGAANSLLADKKRKKTLTERDIEEVVSAIARVPVKSVSSSDEHTLRNLEAKLSAQVFGQEQAVAAIAKSIKRSRANLKTDNKPVGAFLFAGPTGVGKTELAKSLAKELGVHFHRFDMSEYMEKHAVARLIGAPPGYVGYEEGGLLTDMVRRQPYGVLLFDEIEKAHEDIYHILLQVMDDASLTDSHGRKADFRNIILIMTTNAGSEKAGSLGFGNASGGGHRDDAIKKLFKPEFRNRLDEVIYFKGLPFEVIEKIVDKQIRELEAQLTGRAISFEISQEVRRWLAERGFDSVLGARPMARLIQREIKDPLADEILFGKLRKGGQVKVSLLKDKLSFDLFAKE